MELYIIATPIGNLEDISLRALRVLREVDLVISEKPKKTMILLSHFGIRKQISRFHEHTKPKKLNKILDTIEKKAKTAYVCEAGTPGISDPGGKLIFEAIKRWGERIKIIPIPGPCALTTLASVAHFSMDRFLFLGFLPKKKRRSLIIREILNSKYPVIFYESPYRILETLKELRLLSIDFELLVGKELTKKFEKIYRGRIDKVIEEIEDEDTLGEYTIILKRKGPSQEEMAQ